MFHSNVLKRLRFKSSKKKSNIASGVPVMVLLYRSEVIDAIQFEFFARKLAIAFIISLQRSPRETVPRGKAEWDI